MALPAGAAVTARVQVALEVRRVDIRPQRVSSVFREAKLLVHLHGVITYEQIEIHQSLS